MYKSQTRWKSGPKKLKTPLWGPICTRCIPGGEGVIVDPPASPQGSGNNGWFGHQVHCAQITHSLPQLPAVNVCSVEIGNVPEQGKWARLCKNETPILIRVEQQSGGETWHQIQNRTLVGRTSAWKRGQPGLAAPARFTRLEMFQTFFNSSLCSDRNGTSGYLQGSTPEGRGTTGGQNAEHFSQSSESIQIKLGYIFPKLGF